MGRFILLELCWDVALCCRRRVDDEGGVDDVLVLLDVICLRRRSGRDDELSEQVLRQLILCAERRGRFFAQSLALPLIIAPRCCSSRRCRCRCLCLSVCLSDNRRPKFQYLYLPGWRQPQAARNREPNKSFRTLLARRCHASCSSHTVRMSRTGMFLMIAVLPKSLLLKMHDRRLE